ncbi:WecB/TagA/CpsF family glycosyltransferase [Parasegetibacter sp. MAH-26]|uniref:WecB/TagA/CpsF family glycosyltransferase n=2 Tax=Pinibacter aurantiacus TaxID=2851599 RepID=A0A9E2S7F7_9BACT|nr:WecB/TagA/CpsF family glycosyltransferase [Pinibacter aurantiacus]
MVIEAHENAKFRTQVNDATLVVADGSPVAKACKWLYGTTQERIAGMNFMPAILQKANEHHLAVFLYGSSEETLSKLSILIADKYPGVKLAGAISPPFRPLSNDEHDSFVYQINEAKPNLVLVALGCPKQEKWMADNFKKINATLLGLGGAFAVMAGVQKRAPVWMQKYSLEWLFRLIQEPKRLWKRYLITNTLFIWLLIKQKLRRGL